MRTPTGDQVPERASCRTGLDRTEVLRAEPNRAQDHRTGVGWSRSRRRALHGAGVPWHGGEVVRTPADDRAPERASRRIGPNRMEVRRAELNRARDHRTGKRRAELRAAGAGGGLPQADSGLDGGAGRSWEDSRACRTGKRRAELGRGVPNWEATCQTGTRRWTGTRSCPGTGEVPHLSRRAPLWSRERDFARAEPKAAMPNSEPLERAVASRRRTGHQRGWRPPTGPPRADGMPERVEPRRAGAGAGGGVLRA